MTPARLKLIALLLLLTGPGPVWVAAQERARLVWPPAPQQARIEYLSTIANNADIGIESSFLGKLWNWVVGRDEDVNFFVKPMGIQVADDGVLYVADPGAKCVHRIDRRNKSYRSFSETSGGPMRSPVGVAVSSDRRVYVTDSERQEIIVFDDGGDEVFTIRGFFHRPTGIAIHNARLYVVDTGLNKVLVFNLDGEKLLEFGRRGTERGEFNFPVFLAASDRLYLADAMNHRVQVLDDSGTCLLAFGRLGNVQGTFANPKGIAVDDDRNIYVADALFDAVQIFDSTGALLLVVGGPGPGNGQFWMPEGMCIDRENRIYVVDAMNRRIQVFQYLREPK